jgi:hypothetical protein
VVGSIWLLDLRLPGYHPWSLSTTTTTDVLGSGDQGNKQATSPSSRSTRDTRNTLEHMRTQSEKPTADVDDDDDGPMSDVFRKLNAGR